MAGDAHPFGNLVAVHRAGLGDHVPVKAAAEWITQRSDAGDLSVEVGARGNRAGGRVICCHRTVLLKENFLTKSFEASIVEITILDMEATPNDQHSENPPFDPESLVGQAQRARPRGVWLLLIGFTVARRSCSGGQVRSRPGQLGQVPCPPVSDHLPGTPHQAMYVVGIIEIVAGLVGRPPGRASVAYLVAAW